ncbi:hypothetical protein [Kitasatospora sp. MBT63]|uniref:hypothetical protein n=1 Tax=Kitasatospora TaxID=2063 RepID=UPI0013146624|nr:hypothetical protein [Kitasatospora sp. MBT63]
MKRSASVMALAAPCAQLLTRQWAQRNGYRPWEVALLAWAVSALVSAAVLRL